jgi:ubiquinone/menaquinone biosynthesis C-methylase UbiE
MMSDPKSDALREWRESARYWQQHAATIRTMFAPVTEALVWETAIVEGHSVLDVAGGPGEPSLTIAQVVAPSGTVVCTDAIDEMVSAAKYQARDRGITNVEFRQCEADSLPFVDNTFDAAVSRLGVMFFPDVRAGLSELLRVVKPDGRVALAVWGKSEVNPFAYVVTNVMSRHITSVPEEPDAPGAFRFADPGKLAKLLSDAGSIDVRERTLNFHIQAPISVKQFWEMRSQTSGTLREKLAALAASEADKVQREIEDAITEFFPNNQMNVPAQVIIVTGKK